MVVPARFPRRCSRCAADTYHDAAQPRAAACSGVILARRNVRNSRTSARLSMPTTLQTGLIGMAYQYTF
jgi:hypothetical protein